MNTLTEAVKAKMLEKGESIEEAVEDAYFAIGDEEQNEFYDFHEPMKTPECVFKFDANYRPMNIEFSQAKHLIIEGSLMDKNVGVYQVECKENQQEDTSTEPVAVIDTGCRGLSAQVMGEDRIYMGFFMGDDESMNL